MQLNTTLHKTSFYLHILSIRIPFTPFSCSLYILHSFLNISPHKCTIRIKYVEPRVGQIKRQKQKIIRRIGKLQLQEEKISNIYAVDFTKTTVWRICAAQFACIFPSAIVQSNPDISRSNSPNPVRASQIQQTILQTTWIREAPQAR